jgi:hypothetical protein
VVQSAMNLEAHRSSPYSIAVCGRAIKGRKGKGIIVAAYVFPKSLGVGVLS